MLEPLQCCMRSKLSFKSVFALPLVLVFTLICALTISNNSTAASVLEASPTTQAKAPNIIVIMADDLGYGDVSFQGATDLKTPNIDSIAQQGISLDQFYANSTVCSPSRAAFLTGKYPDLSGVPGVIRQNKDNTWGYLDPNSPTIAKELKGLGYQTALIGKWHLGLSSPNTPNERGFDHFHGYLGDMMDDYWTHLRGGINWMRLNEQAIEPKGHATDVFTNWTIQYLDSATESTMKSGKPFFLFLAYNAPHFPIQPPQSYLTRVKKRQPNLSDKRAKNVAFVEHLDDAVGQVLAKLESLGIADNTLIVFTSDNGGALKYAQSNGNLRGGKGDMYEGGIRVPTYVRWPLQIKAGQKSNSVFTLLDLSPTFVKLAGGNIRDEVDGADISPVFSNVNYQVDNRTLFWMRKEGHKYSGLTYYSARRGDLKLVQNSPFEPLKFFNLAKDPLEQNAMKIGANKKFVQLRSDLMKHIQRSGKVVWQKPAVMESK